MTWQYTRSNRFYAVCADGLEDLLSNELSTLGASDISASYRGVYFTSGLRTVYSVNYCSRLATHVLAPLISFDCHSTKYLYKTAREIEWESLFDAGKTFAITSNVSNSAITHSQYAALVLKDAIVDRFRESGGRRPDVDRRTPDVWLDLFIDSNKAVISLDTSGGSLHRRGYRLESVGAPMQETVAAAAVLLSEWSGETPLHDPMCGSGTLLSEAHMRYCRIPAACLRESFGFELLPGFEPKVWKSVKREADACITKPVQGLLSGGDIDPAAVRAARRNLSALPGGDAVKIGRIDFRDAEIEPGTVILTNPPYGLRLGDKQGAQALAGDLGDFLKKKCTGSTAYIYFGDRELLKHIGLRTAWKKPLRNGQLDGRLARFNLY